MKEIILTLLLFVLLCYLYLYYLFNKQEKENSPPDYLKLKANAVIPLNIFQTWSIRNLPPKMKNCVNKIKQNNPEFTHYLFDDADCRHFIQQHFTPDVLYAYDHLVPGAYRADLWRYCVLYKLGGIYLDIKLEPIGDFRFIEIVDQEYWVLDRPYSLQNATVEHDLYIVNCTNYYEHIHSKISHIYWDNRVGIYNALMVCKPNNPLLKRCIDQVVYNTRNKYYGYNSLYPTGPGMIVELLSEKEYKDMIQNAQLFNSLGGSRIVSKRKPILKHYPEYRNEQAQCKTVDHYTVCWANKTVYRKDDDHIQSHVDVKTL